MAGESCGKIRGRRTQQQTEESLGAQGRPVRTSAWTQTGTSGKDREANTPESHEEINETEPGARDLEITRVTEKRGRPERANL